jgi:lactoylglutathione lyase
VVPGTGLSHFVIAVESMDAIVTRLAGHGIDTGTPGAPDGSEDFLTTMITDPDGNRIELVQWPAGHPDGMTAADWADSERHS